MRKNSNSPKPGQIGKYWLSQKSGRKGHDGAWCRTWYDPKCRQTRSVSLGTSDFSVASKALAEWVVKHGERQFLDPANVLIDEVLLRYWNAHGCNRPSHKSIFDNLAAWQKFWGGRMVSDITPQEQKRFVTWLQTEWSRNGLSTSSVDKVLSAGRAALNRAYRQQELTSAPHIFLYQSAEDRRESPPMGRPVTPAEIAKLFDAVQSRHVLMYLILAVTTLARPAAILDLTLAQIDHEHGLLSLNPDGRKQTKKYRPTIPIAPTLRPWLDETTGPTGHFVFCRGKRINKISTAFRELVQRAGLDTKVTPYSIRHGMARSMRRQRVPTEEIGAFLGHLPRGSSATTAVYAPFEPEYMDVAVQAIEATLVTVRQHLKRMTIDRPSGTPSDLLGSLIIANGRANRGIGDAKRQEVRQAILAGLPHGRIVRELGVSSGTVSALRKALREDGIILLGATPIDTRRRSAG